MAIMVGLVYDSSESFVNSFAHIRICMCKVYSQNQAYSLPWIAALNTRIIDAMWPVYTCVCLYTKVGAVSSAWPGELRCNASSYLQAGVGANRQPLRGISDCLAARDGMATMHSLTDVPYPLSLVCLTPVLCHNNSSRGRWKRGTMENTRVENHFHPCVLVRCFPVPSFPPLRFGPTFSSPDFSSPAFSVPPPVVKSAVHCSSTQGKMRHCKGWFTARELHLNWLVISWPSYATRSLVTCIMTCCYYTTPV